MEYLRKIKIMPGETEGGRLGEMGGKKEKGIVNTKVYLNIKKLPLVITKRGKKEEIGKGGKKENQEGEAGSRLQLCLQSTLHLHLHHRHHLDDI